MLLDLMVVELVTTADVLWNPQGPRFLMLQCHRCLSVSIVFPSPHYHINMSGAKGRRSHPWLFAPQLRSCHSLMKRCDGSISDSKYFSQSTSYHEISVFIPKYSFGQSFPSCSVMYCFWKRWCRRRPRGVELATVPHHELQWRCFCQLWWILPKPLGWMMGNVYRKTSLGLRGFFFSLYRKHKDCVPFNFLAWPEPGSLSFKIFLLILLFLFRGKRSRDWGESWGST